MKIFAFIEKEEIPVLRGTEEKTAKSSRSALLLLRRFPIQPSKTFIY